MSKTDIAQSIIAVLVPTGILIALLFAVSMLGMMVVKELKSDKQINHAFTVAGKVANKSISSIEKWADTP